MPNKSIDQIIRSVSAKMMLLALGGGVVLFIALIFHSYRDAVSREQSRVDLFRIGIEREITKELLIGDARAIKFLIPGLVEEYKLEKLSLNEDINQTCPLLTYCTKIPIREFTQVAYVQSAIPFSYLSEMGRFVFFLFPFFLFVYLLNRGVSRNLNLAIAKPLKRMPNKIDLNDSTQAAEMVELGKTLQSFLNERELQKFKEIEYAKIETQKHVNQQVAHDIRSPLVALQHGIQSINKHLGSAERDLIQSAILRINQMADQLLTDGETQPERVEFNQLIESMVAEKRLEYQNQENVNIQSEALSFPTFVTVEPVEMKRVVSNLVNNSVSALNETGGEVLLQVVREDNWVQLVVKDNGVGIAPEKLPHVFNKGTSFPENSSQHLGSGLGLFHAKQTIESWGGDINIQSTPKKGTSIRIELPIEGATE